MPAQPTIAVRESRTDLLEVGPSTGLRGGNYKLIYVIGKGLYRWRTGDQSGNISGGNSADDWVAPSEDTSGKSGAWERLTPEETTGSDGNVVTGTSGTSGNFVQWNADGDATDSGKEVSDFVTQSDIDAGDPTLDTVVDATNGGSDDLTEIDFTGIKSGAKRITVMVDNLSATGTDVFVAQLGDSGGIEPSGYGGSIGEIGATPEAISFSTGFPLVPSSFSSDARMVSGLLLLTLMDSTNHVWAASGTLALEDTNATIHVAGTKTLSGELDRVRITTDGSNTFDNGNVNIMVE